MDKIFIGAAIGLGCGVIPLLIGILVKHKLIGIIGLASCTAGGVLFAFLDKPPITSIAIAAVFLIIILMTKIERHHHSENIEKGIYAETLNNSNDNTQKDENKIAENDEKHS